MVHRALTPLCRGFQYPGDLSDDRGVLDRGKLLCGVSSESPRADRGRSVCSFPDRITVGDLALLSVRGFLGRFYHPHN